MGFIIFFLVVSVVVMVAIVVLEAINLFFIKITENLKKYIKYDLIYFFIMIKVISVDNQAIEFAEEEIKLSVLLKTMCLDDFEKRESIQLPKVDSDNLFYIKRLSMAIIENNITEEKIKAAEDFEDINNSITNYLRLKDGFTMEHLFKLLDCVNFLENIIIIKLIKKKISTILKISTVDEIKNIFKLVDNDFNDTEKSKIAALSNMVN